MKSTLVSLTLFSAAALAQVPFCPAGIQFPTAYCCARNIPLDPKNPNQDGVFYYNCYQRNHFGCFGRYAPWDVCCDRLQPVNPTDTVTIPNVPSSQKIINIAVRCTLGNKAPRLARDVQDME